MVLLTIVGYVATLVLKAQEKTFSSLSGIGHAKLGTMTWLLLQTP